MSENALTPLTLSYALEFGFPLERASELKRHRRVIASSDCDMTLATGSRADSRVTSITKSLSAPALDEEPSKVMITFHFSRRCDRNACSASALTTGQSGAANTLERGDLQKAEREITRYPSRCIDKICAHDFTKSVHSAELHF